MHGLELRDFILVPSPESSGHAELYVAYFTSRIIHSRARRDGNGHQSPQRFEKIPSRVRGRDFLVKYFFDVPSL
jgi:hypothetical protein